MAAGVQHNVVPDSASVCFDIRLTPTIDYAQFRRRLETLASDNGADVEFVQFWPDNTMTPTDTSNPFWLAFERALAAMDIPIFKEIFPAATDARYLRRAGIPALGVTPLRNAPILLHDHNEFVKESEFLDGIDFYVNVISAIANI
ncbi:adenylate cyclase [Coemansia erecta]|nr:adenylate cyclase [Coemansia erecta]